jgi:hypothetical protein
VVAGSWKGVNYVREYVVPANPNTVLQQAQRTLMQTIVLYCKQLLTALIQPYWDPLSTVVSGWNLIVKKNLKSMSDSTDFENFKISDGSLEGDAISSCTYSTGDGEVMMSFSGEIKSNGLATDKCIACIIDIEHDFLYLSVDEETRSAAGLGMTIATGLTVANLKSYLAFHRADGTLMSQTAYKQVTAA